MKKYKGTIFNVLHKRKKGLIPKRMLRGILYSSMKLMKLYNFLFSAENVNQDPALGNVL